MYKIIDLESRLQYMSSAGVTRLKIPDVKRYYGCTFPLDFYPETTRTILTDHLDRTKAGEISNVECPIYDMEGNEVWFYTTFLLSPIELSRAFRCVYIGLCYQVCRRFPSRSGVNCTLREHDYQFGGVV